MRYPHFYIALVILFIGVPLIAIVPRISDFLLTSSALQAIHNLIEYPGFSTMVSQALITAVVTLLLVTGFTVVTAQYLVPLCQSRSHQSWLGIFSMPHLAFAVALLWLLAPTGWLWRIIPVETPWMPWFDRQYLVTLWIVLILKELPFMWFMTVRALQQLPIERWLLVGQSQGRSVTRTWWLVVIPALLARLRLPLCVVAVYSLTVVDLAIFAAPQTPAPLAVQIVQWQLEFNAQSQALAMIASLVLTIIAGLLCGWVVIQEHLLKQWGQRILVRPLYRSERWLLRLTAVGRRLPLLFIVLSILLLIALVALAHGQSWFYPALLPQQWRVSLWTNEWAYLWSGVWRSFWIACCVAALSILLAIVTAEWQRTVQKRLPMLLLLLPLLIPQVFLVLIWIPFTTTAGGWVILAHLPFSYAYALLAFLPAEERFEQRYLHQSQALGYSFWQSWWRIKRPLLMVPLKTAFALAMLVSIAQYVPTLLIGGGRVATLTTDFVALSSGADQSMQAVYAITMWLLCSIVLLVLRPRIHSRAGEMQ